MWRHLCCFFFLFFIYPLLLSDVLSSFYRLSSPSQWKVYAGYLTLSQMKSAIGNSVMLIISHPGFDTDNNNDIALMKLWTPLQISCELQYKSYKEVCCQKTYTRLRLYLGVGEIKGKRYHNIAFLWFLDLKKKIFLMILYLISIIFAKITIKKTSEINIKSNDLMWKCLP